jgi:hypothetical protein
MDLMVASTSTNFNHQAKDVSANISIPKTIIKIPKKTIGPVVKGSFGVTAFDISPDQAGRYVAGGSDGQVHIGNLGISGDSEESDNDLEPDLDDIERLARRRMRKREKERERQSKTYLKGHVGDVRSAQFFPSGQGESGMRRAFLGGTSPVLILC